VQEQTAGLSGAPTRWWSRALVAGTAVAVCALVCWHLAASFLYDAPPNPVSQRYAKQINWWMNPLFAQDWQLFAPNPFSENVDIQVRGSLAAGGASTLWYDLSAVDAATALHDPAPTQLAQNGLRNAWLEWSGTHDSAGKATGPDAGIAQQYLLAFARSRLAAVVPAPLGALQIRVITTLIPGSGRTAAQTAPQVRELDWWPL
jgi:hypothetical protein